MNLSIRKRCTGRSTPRLGARLRALSIPCLLAAIHATADAEKINRVVR